MEKRMRRFETIVERLASDSPNLEELKKPEDQSGEALPVSQETTIEPQPSPHARNNNQLVNHWEIVMDLDSGPEAIPGFYISETPLAQLGSDADFISRGIVSLQSAQCYFDKYRDRIDHFPYRILNDHGPVTLESVRTTSPLLVAAVCAVGALHTHTASKDFDLCYKEFVSLCAMQTFSKHNSLDDIRALCIAAFWLSDLSWTLVGTAVRMAADLQLHRSIFKAMQGDRQHYLRTRLWYLVYACDHHFSVAYGRPPMTRECEAVRNVRNFLACEHATEDDSRLVSQVLRWSICSNIFDTFGVDVDRPLSDAEVPQLRLFGTALDSVRAEWVDRFVKNVHVGNYPQKGVTLQYHFAKLYLCSHTFRGSRAGKIHLSSHAVSLERETAANAAVLSATSILRAVVSDTEIQSYLDGLPIYFNVMIAFAAVFLLKVSTKFTESVEIDVEEIKSLMTALVMTLRHVTSTMHPKHLLVSITKGIESLIQRCGLKEESSSTIAIGRQQFRDESETLDGDLDWIDDQYVDPYFMGEYDFLLGQDMNFDVHLPAPNRSYPPVP